MNFSEVFTEVIRLLAGPDPDLIEIVLLSLKVSLVATIVGCCIGLPLGALLATRKFIGKSLLTVITNTLMGIPPVVLGLIVYISLSRSGPLGFLQLLYTPAAMMIAQFLLVVPIVIALTRQLVEDSWRDYQEPLQSLGVSGIGRVNTLLWDNRFSLVTVALTGFARAISEVGAVIVVGGNIDHLTRVMTTAIALETSKGNLALALALGIILLIIALVINTVVYSARWRLS